jgi:hypothetical protein
MTNTTIHYGTTITASHLEPLTAMPVSDVIAMIKGEKGNLREEIRRLHNIRRLDVNAYRRAKTVLPFICGATFKGGIRKAENFEIIESFVLDFDNCAATVEDLQTLKEALVKRPDTWFCYISPSSKGLKAGFALQYPLREAKSYADFYKTFALQVARKLSLADKVDLNCHDVARVSFLSYDPEVYFNPEPQPVNPEQFVAPLFPLETIEEALPQAEQVKPIDRAKATPDKYQDILKVLNPKFQQAKEKPAPYVPEMLEHIKPLVQSVVGEQGIKVQEVTPIQFGLKFRFIHGLHLAELNIFYGKKGFSVVISPKRDTHPELNELVYKLIFTELHSINVVTEKITYVLTAHE